MPNVSHATFNSWMPSIGRIFHATPKVLTGFLAAFGGALNIRAASADHYGGGLTAQANVPFQESPPREIKACPNRTTVRPLPPLLADVGYMLQTVKNWEEIGGDDMVPALLSGGPDLTLHVPERSLRDIKDIMRRNEKFGRAMNEAEDRFLAQLSNPPDLLFATRAHTSKDLLRLLQESGAVETFKHALSGKSSNGNLSFRLGDMVRIEVGLADRLRPEPKHLQADHDHFNNWLDSHFASQPGDLMNYRQLRSLLSLLAEHLNAKYSIRAN
ncbi:MAG TPA: hypothetical protein VIM98_16770 [Dyella sp.]|uniref:hypothetical protein n=1 Tax=Dyella sp. TaxID=1869338 RepID=UPI002F95AB32